LRHGFLLCFVEHRDDPQLRGKEVTENKTRLATATLVARTIREPIHQELNLTASAEVARNKFLAKTAFDWRKPNGLFVIQPDEVDALLMPLPVGRFIQSPVSRFNRTGNGSNWASQTSRTTDNLIRSN
jgi:nucleotidyltransferase/DNA polymerase involved in DNA repair